MFGNPCFWPQNPCFCLKIRKLFLNLFPSYFRKIFASSKRPDISKKFPTFDNRTIPKLAKTKSSENSVFCRALISSIQTHTRRSLFRHNSTFSTIYGFQRLPYYLWALGWHKPWTQVISFREWVKEIQSVSRIWTSLICLSWFGFRLKPMRYLLSFY